MRARDGYVEAKTETAGPSVDVKTLHSKIGQLTLKKVFCSVRLARPDAVRKEVIDRKDKLSVVRQAKLLGVSSGSVYYSKHAVSGDDLALMRRVNRLSFQLLVCSKSDFEIGLQWKRLPVATLMTKMRIMAIDRYPNASA